MPKKQIYSQKNIRDSQSKSVFHTPKKNPSYNEISNSKKRRKSTQKDNDHIKFHDRLFSKPQFEDELSQKVAQFRTLSKTLKEFIKKEEKNKSSKQKLDFFLKMILAFNRAEIKQTSLAAKELIDQIIQCIQGICENGEKEELKHEFKHEKQYSFSESFQNQKLKYGNYISNEVQMLYHNLNELKEEAKALSDFEEEIADKEEAQKYQYIQELQQIIQNQDALLHQLSEEENF